MSDAKKGFLQQLRESTVGKAIDKAIEQTDKFLGPSGKAWLANGLDEIRQALHPANQQVQPGNNPGLWGSITTGEATAERMAGLEGAFEVPGLTIAAMRAQAKELVPQREMRREPERAMEM